MPRAPVDLTRKGQAKKDTGFHRQDADWTRGREMALAHAEVIRRRQDGMLREVSMASEHDSAGNG